TDRADYPPGSAAYIIGDGFLPKETVRLQVLHADGTPSTGDDHEPWSVQANAQGEFASAWHVCEDDCLGAVLELTAAGQRSGLTARTQFTDGPSSNGQLQGWYNLALQWGGTIQSVNSKYGEGDSLPLRFTATLAPGSSHTLLLQYNFSSGGSQRFFDSLASYNVSVTNADPASGITGLGAVSSWLIPADSSLPVGAQTAGFLTAYNVTSVTFGSYTLVNAVKMIPVTFVVAGGGGNQNVVLAYGGHLASENVWGLHNGAAQFPGASTKAYASLDGGPNANVSVNPGAVVETADLSLSKTVSPAPVFAGTTLTYQLTVVNSGPDAATSVVVTDPIPAGTTFASATTSQGTFSGTTTLSFALGTINAGASAAMTIVVNVADATTGTITNNATVSAATIDPNTANNNATALTTRDTTPPIITCPADIIVSTAPGQCSAIVNYTVTTADNNPGLLICDPPSGSSFPKGTNTVVCTATDAVGNTSTCSFHIIVRDTEEPAIGNCPAHIVKDNDPGQCGAVVTFPAPTATDNCPDPVSLVCAPASGSFFPTGTTTVTCTATDGAGNRSSCSFTVTVNDTEPPKIACPTNIVVSTDAGACDARVTFPTPVATDDCPGTITVLCNPPSGTVFPIGDTPVTCTATDAVGNVSVCTFTVTVQDSPNVSWPQALALPLADNAGVQQAAFDECITAMDQSRWFKFRVQPGSKIIVTLTDLPANYDLVLFKDIAAAFDQLTSQQDLTRLSAEFANDAFSPAAFSADAFSPAAFSPAAFSPAAFSPAAFSPAAFSPAAFSPAAFSPAAFSPDAFAPAAFSPAAFSPAAFSPAAFSPAAFSPAAFSPAAFSAAQVQSVIAVSAFDGNAGEGIIANTWDNAGDFYVRVRGRNGAFSPGAPFHLQVFMVTGACGQVSSVPLDA
ncbi:MAG TPA: HYR domain-containing protein, partial [Haliangiales bacterium]|nr:HYR domain-containing protein [Haliangiales bacterium]